MLPGLSVQPCSPTDFRADLTPLTVTEEESPRRVKRKTRPISEIVPPLLGEAPPLKRVKQLRKPPAKKKKKINEVKHGMDDDEAKYWRCIDAERWDWDAIVPHLP